MAKGGWFSSVKKALGLRSKRSSKSKKILIVNELPSVSDAPNPEPFEAPNSHPPPQLVNMRPTEVENEQTKHAHSVAVSAAIASEAEIASEEATPEVVPLPTVTRVSEKHQEEVAALKIQTAFRGYLARRALRALRGLVRLKSLVDGPAAERQTSSTLKCLQTLSHLQSQIQSRRTRMLDESRAMQRQLLQRRVKELDSLKMEEEWDDSPQTKEETEASLLQKYEAAMRRERALAYSYTHQQTWKKSSKLNNLLFMDPTNPHWGWSWLERWMAATPLDTKSTAGKDLNGDRSSIKGSTTVTAAGEITKAFARHQLNSDNPSPAASQKPSHTHLPSPRAVPSLAARKLRNASPKVSMMSQDDDSRSVFSVQSERNRRRHSIAGSVRDDESLDSSPSIPSYMTPTRSAKARLKSHSPSGMENGSMVEKETTAFPKKRLSFPPSPGRARRHSGPPKVDTSTLVNDNANGG
ncbi:protein IQ-DOMAIN 1-like [Salvia splendens]|uniref:protein IQ-DOMAIN 1-like n=1 Tax=Salvia splendens TaxID=180675 RepID=UPI001C26846A|nr:protein IQ-DOMAIN 1-like [Salvia splendens]XP_041998789.1 protein IQ-DOMAIN 1-like [Salvia splendens]XP_041998790.1 protein IQ-DOMAIN 1-like [Salvia splendens]